MLKKPFTLLRTALESTFLPALFGSEVNQAKNCLMVLSGQNGGLDIRNPVDSQLFSFIHQAKDKKYSLILLLMAFLLTWIFTKHK